MVDSSMMGGTNGSLGGATAADLDKGYMSEQPAVEGNDWDMDDIVQTKEGFVGRPQGWER